jgi:hypothetical protein
VERENEIAFLARCGLRSFFPCPIEGTGANPSVSFRIAETKRKVKATFLPVYSPMHEHTFKRVRGLDQLGAKFHEIRKDACLDKKWHPVY